MDNSTNAGLTDAIGVAIVVVVVGVLGAAAMSVAGTAAVGTDAKLPTAAVTIWSGAIGLSPIRTALFNSTAKQKSNKFNPINSFNPIYFSSGSRMANSTYTIFLNYFDFFSVPMFLMWIANDV